MKPDAGADSSRAPIRVPTIRTADPTEPRRFGLSRRTVLKSTGLLAVGSVVGLAGCADGGPGEEGTEEEDENGAANGAEDEENGTGEVLPPDEEVQLDGQVEAWTGTAPGGIEGEENPTLVLQSGESYDITWENADGQVHNLEIVDENDEVVDDYETEEMDEQGETQTLTIDEVTDEMAEYVCRPHEGTMRGEIQVEEGENGGEDDAAAEDEQPDDENGNGEPVGDEETDN